MSAITHPNHPNLYAILSAQLSRGIDAAALLLRLFDASSQLAVRVGNGHHVTMSDLRKVGLL